MTATQIPADVEREVTRAVSGPADSLIERLAERLGGSASAAAVYGTPIERDGLTVIPVANVRWGFGGGGGVDTKEAGSSGGSGGGGGAMAAPIGYIEIKDGEARFRPIKDPLSLPAVPLTNVLAGIVGLLFVRSIVRLFRG
jgi:uncharacterized spore protein YtfJ